jgi:hypothetical protein
MSSKKLRNFRKLSIFVPSQQYFRSSQKNQCWKQPKQRMKNNKQLILNKLHLKGTAATRQFSCH